jgi:FixJ family two-component response regulator
MAADAPGMSGVRVLHLLRDADLDLPVILLGDESVKAAASRPGAVVLKKPIAPAAVVHAARTALAQGSISIT